MMKDSLKAKCERLLNGQRVVMSDKEMDELIPYNIGVYVASLPNPNRVGILDRWLVFIKNTEKAKADKPFELAK